MKCCVGRHQNLKLKVLFLPIFLLPFFLCSRAEASGEHLLINEIYPNPITGEVEWIEIYNPSSNLVKLDQYSITDSVSSKDIDLLKFPEIPAKSYLVFEKGTDFQFVLNNDEDTVSLRREDPVGTFIIIDQVVYSDQKVFPADAPAPDQGLSLTRYLDEPDTDIYKEDFHLAKPSYGLPTSKPIYSSQIKITEIFPTTANEYIKLFNEGESEVDLFLWSFDRDDGTPPKVLKSSQIISSKSYLTLYHSQSGVILLDGGGTIRLCDPEGVEVSRLKYPVEKTIDDNPTILTIPEVRDEPLNQFVTTIGVVTAPPISISDNYFYIQDGISGLQVYQSKGDFPTLKAGDRIQVTGTISSISNERRIKINSSADIIILSHTDPPTPIPKEVSEIGEPDEGKYVKIEGTVEDPSGSTFYLKNRESRIKVYIRNPEVVDKPSLREGYAVSVVGIVSQYRDEYRILPFEAGAVKIIGAKNSALPQSGASEYLPLILSFIITNIWNILAKMKQKRASWLTLSPER